MSKETTFEEARRCPRCENPGVDESQRQGPRGSKLHIIRCLNERCRWYDTTFIVQVNSDGTIAKPDANRQKFFPKVPDRTDAIQRSMDDLYRQTISGDGEVYG